MEWLPVSTGIEKIRHVPIFLRGCFYMTGIFGVELASGSVLKYFKICPWDYSSSQIQYKGLIGQIMLLYGFNRPAF